MGSTGLDEPAIDDVIRSLYDAAMNESLWPAALKGLMEATGSQAATFWVLEASEHPRLPIFTSVNFDPEAIAEYLKDVAALDPTVQYLVRHPTERIVHDGLVITEREKARHPYYAWHDKRIETRFRLVGQMSPAPAMQAGVALHRTRQVGRFEPADVERFSRLYAHLEKALAIGFRLGSLGAMQQCATDLLDQNPAAIVLLDSHKRIVYSNRSAESLRAATDGICLSGNALLACRRDDDNQLQGLISSVLRDGSADGFMRVLRPSGKRPWSILVAAASHRFPALSLFRPAVCIVITDPDSQRRLPLQRLRSAFHLTDAEARLACILADGHELHAAAAELKITYGTARARLAAIFAKTETRRQGELVKVLLTTLT